jgi:hypothetical protein
MKLGPGPSCTTISMGSECVSMGTYEKFSLGDLNLRPISSRRGLLEGSLYREIWSVLFVMQLSHDHAPRAWRPSNVPWTPSMGSEYVLITYAVLFVQR